MIFFCFAFASAACCFVVFFQEGIALKNPFCIISSSVAVFAGANGPDVPKVAFFAGLKDNQGPVTENSDLIFDTVITNVGGAFSGETGRFTAPYNGTFQFTVVVAAQGRQRVRFFDERMERICQVYLPSSLLFFCSLSFSSFFRLLCFKFIFSIVSSFRISTARLEYFCL